MQVAFKIIGYYLTINTLWRFQKWQIIGVNVKNANMLTLLNAVDTNGIANGTNHTKILMRCENASTIKKDDAER